MIIFLNALFSNKTFLHRAKDCFVISVDTFDVNGSRICYGQMSIVAVGAGGFGGKRDTDKNIDIVDPPNRKPDASEYQTTSHDQVSKQSLEINKWNKNMCMNKKTEFFVRQFITNLIIYFFHP